MENTVQVTEKMAAFVDWAYNKGQDEVRRMIRERLDMLKEECGKNGGRVDSEGFKWDDALEANDGNDQWKHGGDCNLCRKVSYCLTKCRANKLLKAITTQFLYQCYLEENPEVMAEEAKKTITPDDVLKGMGVQ